MNQHLKNGNKAIQEKISNKLFDVTKIQGNKLFDVTKIQEEINRYPNWHDRQILRDAYVHKLIAKTIGFMGG
jgi:hypothetical protein